MKTFRIVTDLDVPESATEATLREILERIGTPSSDTQIVEIPDQNDERPEQARVGTPAQSLFAVPLPSGVPATESGTHAEEPVGNDDDDVGDWINIYRCVCGTQWEDRWSCQCNDRCPKCDREIEPLESYRAAA